MLFFKHCMLRNLLKETTWVDQPCCVNEGSGVQQDHYNTRWTVHRLSYCVRHLGTRSMAVRALGRFSGTETPTEHTCIHKFDFSEAYKRKWSFANVFVNCFKAKLPIEIEIEFCVVYAEYLVSGLNDDTTLLMSLKWQRIAKAGYVP